MFDKILQQMRDKIKARQYVMTIHAEEEMSDDNLRSMILNKLFSQVKY